MVQHKSGTDPAEVGARIKTLREGHHWEQIELARRAGLDKGTISRIEAGKRGLSAQTLEKSARALDVPTDALMRADSQPASTSAPGPQDYASGFRAGWKDGWDAAVAMLRGAPSAGTRSPR